MPFATAEDGARLYYETIGTGEALLLVMGQGLDHRGWDYVREDFAARYQVIVYDHRGTAKVINQSIRPIRRGVSPKTLWRFWMTWASSGPMPMASRWGADLSVAWH